MKKSKFTDEQIIVFVKHAYAGMFVKELTVQATFVSPPWSSCSWA
jgi:hypothetical protein